MNDARTQQADALIGELQREHGGRLTVFLGAAPGVGKTYAMLSRARERLRQGMDVVAGVVETHGRSETAALLEGFAAAAARARELPGPHAGRTRSGCIAGTQTAAGPDR